MSFVPDGWFGQSREKIGRKINYKALYDELNNKILNERKLFGEKIASLETAYEYREGEILWMFCKYRLKPIKCLAIGIKILPHENIDNNQPVSLELASRSRVTTVLIVRKISDNGNWLETREDVVLPSAAISRDLETLKKFTLNGFENLE